MKEGLEGGYGGVFGFLDVILGEVMCLVMFVEDGGELRHEILGVFWMLFG